MENIIDPGDESEYVYVLNRQDDNYPAGWGRVLFINGCINLQKQ